MGESGTVVLHMCGPGPWRVAHVTCPWCKDLRRCLAAEVFGGWCGSDFLCGTCGTRWSSDQDGPLKTSEAEREENIARVAAQPDPKCWDCHDSGWTGESPVDIGHSCACPAGIAVLQSGPACPLEYESATGFFDAAGYDAEDCAGCGRPLSEHSQPPYSPVSS